MLVKEVKAQKGRKPAVCEKCKDSNAAYKYRGRLYCSDCYIIVNKIFREKQLESIMSAWQYRTDLTPTQLEAKRAEILKDWGVTGRTKATKKAATKQMQAKPIRIVMSMKPVPTIKPAQRRKESLKEVTTRIVLKDKKRRYTKRKEVVTKTGFFAWLKTWFTR